jgi:hypothetical protein
MYFKFPLLFKEGWPQQTNDQFKTNAFLRPGWLIMFKVLFLFVILRYKVIDYMKKPTTPAGEKYYANN